MRANSIIIKKMLQVSLSLIFNSTFPILGGFQLVVKTVYVLKIKNFNSIINEIYFFMLFKKSSE